MCVCVGGCHTAVLYTRIECSGLGYGDTWQGRETQSNIMTRGKEQLQCQINTATCGSDIR